MSNLMSFETFIEEIKRKVSVHIGYEKNVVVCPVMKNNDVIYQGLIIMDEMVNISPTIYLNSRYDRYKDGVCLEDIVEDIMKTYRNNKPSKDFDVSQFKEFEKAKKNLVMRLVNTEKNMKLLKQIPNRPFYDLSIVYSVMVNDFMDEYASILIYNQHMNLWGVTEDELYAVAMENSPILLPYRFDNLKTILESSDRGVWSEFADMQMYILTNQTKIQGAVSIVYPRLLKRISDFLEDDLLIIPSSVHEILIMSKSSICEEVTIEEMNRMVKEVNRTELAEDEVLSEHVYCFKRDEMKMVY